MLVPTRVHRFLMSDPIEAVNRDFGQLVDRLFSNGDVKSTAVYAADVKEDSDHIYIEAELPGFRKDEVDVTLEKNVLNITAERKGESPAKAPAADATTNDAEANTPHVQADLGWLLRERQTAAFQRSFRLPPTVSEGEVEARFTDGVLYITLNKRAEVKPRKISVS